MKQMKLKLSPEEAQKQAKEIMLKAYWRAYNMLTKNGFGPDTAESRAIWAASQAEQEFKS